MNDNPNILVVDDESINRRLAAGILTAAGWHVDDSETGEAAVLAVQRIDYALVLMDIQMPGMDGFAAANSIRNLGGAAARVPILAFTAVPPGDAIERARAAGMDGHIAKPFTPESLTSAVAPWWPTNDPAPAASLVAIFGAEEIAKLLGRFREQLEEALAANDDVAGRRTRAHKIAGISGTLGFADVSRTWLAVSEGDESGWDEARATARRALRRIALPDDSGT